jgi:hypothetical protein
MQPCDITKVDIVTSLLKVPQANRGADWTASFFSAVVDASFACGSPQLFTGPDGFTYFALFSPEPYKPFDSFCLCNLAEQAVDGGFGVAINPRQSSVDWVFSCGDLLTLQLLGSFEAGDNRGRQELPAKETLASGEMVLFGQPSESFLPTAARRHIRHYLQERAGVKVPGVILMSRPNEDPPEQLVFSVFRRDFSTDDAFQSILRGISWYLPQHYAVVGFEAPSESLSEFDPL